MGEPQPDSRTAAPSWILSVELLRMKSGSLEAGGTPVEPTQIDDLPDECLVAILSRLTNILDHQRLPIPRKFHEDIAVRHPLQCALVCKRWRTLADSAVHHLYLSPFDTILHVHPHLSHTVKSLALKDACHASSDALVSLALLTPRLEQLELCSYDRLPLPPLELALAKWTSLRRLVLHRNLIWRPTHDEIQTRFDAFSTMASLQHLSLHCDANLPTVCARIDEMTSLTSLALGCCDVPPAGSRRLPAILKELNLFNFEGTYLPDSLGLFTSLEALRLDTAEFLKALPGGSLTHMARLTQLEVSFCCQLYALPEALGRLGSLKILQLVLCPIRLWPTSLRDLSALRTLELVGCRRGPPNLGQLMSLENFIITNQRRMPAGLQELPELRRLEILDMSELAEHGSVLDQHLSSLECLNVRSYASHILASLGGLAALRELDVFMCRGEMEELPESLWYLSSLEVCKLGYLTDLRRLPESIGEWRALTVLEVDHCDALTALPEGLGHLGSLRELRLSDCWQLGSLPQSLGSLSSLRLLNLIRCTSLARLPESAGDMRALRVLNVRECPALEPLPESLTSRSGLRIRHS